MAREINKLTVRTIDAIAAPGRYSDGGNLFLVVAKSGAKRWGFLYRWQGKPVEMGFGSAGRGQVTLAKARELASAARAILADGVNPLQSKREAEAAAALEKALQISFGEFAENLVDDIEGGFRNAKHRQQWRNTLKTYCKPIWKTPLPEVDTAGVLKCLSPIWQSKTETATRLRGRIERVLDAAKAKGLRKGDNPAVWRGHLSATLPKPGKLARGHHAALPYDAMPGFMVELRVHTALAAKCLEFKILTIARSGEALKAEWAEFDLAAGVWTIPAERMKAGREHRVALSNAALAIVTALQEGRQGKYVFPGTKPGKPLSEMAMAMLLRRMGRTQITVHGFRSTFTDWATEVSSFSSETRKACMAHAIADKVEAAYRRGDQFEKRRLMLEAWAAWCEPKVGGNVVALHKIPG